MTRPITVLFLAVLAASYGAHVNATILPPIGLTPGSQYQLIFVTTTLLPGGSSPLAIEDPLNNLVSNQTFNTSLPTAQWHSITSVGTTAANVNAPWLGLPVYNTQGIQVNLPGQSLYSGSLLNPVKYDENGEFTHITRVWTGSNPDGSPFAALGENYATTGDTGSTGGGWLDDGGLDATLSNAEPLYALSDAITLPAPEPSSMILTAIGLGGLVAAYWRRRNR